MQKIQKVCIFTKNAILKILQNLSELFLEYSKSTKVSRWIFKYTQAIKKLLSLSIHDFLGLKLTTSEPL